MMRKLILIPILFLLLHGCSRPVSEQSFMIGVLERENLADSNTLILYISQGMCSECINKELINLNENNDIAENTVIVGSFPNKRHFLASVSSVMVKRKIFIPEDKMPEVSFAAERQPHYLLYVASAHSFGQLYYPVDCSPERTLEYYRNIRPMFPSALEPTKVSAAIQ